MLRIGAVAYAPYVVTIFEGLKRHFHRESVERTTGLREDSARAGRALSRRGHA